MVNRLPHPNCKRNITWAHVTWTHVMLRVQLGCERRFTIEFYGQIHTSVTLLTSRDLTCQHASHISVVTHISWDVTTWPTCRVLFRRYQLVVCRKTYCLCRRQHWNWYGWNVISPDCLAPNIRMRWRDMTICVCAVSHDLSSRDVRIVCPRP